MSKSITQKCKIENCEGRGKPDSNGKRYFIKGYCMMHNARLTRNGGVGDELLRCIRDGKKKHKLYSTHRGMKERCYNPRNKRYEHYGGRGITVCDRWLGIYGFSNFIEDMGDKPSPSHTLDRIDNNKGYSPENCRWATYHQQAANKCNSNKVVGVHYDKGKNMYIASMQINRVRLNSKYFKTYQEAVDYRKKIELEYNVFNN